MTNEELEKKVENLTRVVGNQSVIIHNLLQKFSSMVELHRLDNDPESPGTQLYNIIESIGEFVDETNQFLEEVGLRNNRPINFTED